MAQTKDVLKKVIEKKPFKLNINDTTVLDSGCTLMNLIATGRVDACFVKGGYHLCIGDSSAGKTILSLTCLAEAAENENFKEYDFIFDNNEDGAHFDMEFYFGKKATERIIAPHNGISNTVEDFYDNIDDAFINMLGGSRTEKGSTTNKKVVGHGRPFIYILDSENGLTSEYELEKNEEQKEARAKGKDSTGSYGDGKAKKHSEKLRGACKKFAANGCILNVLSQTRDNIGAGLFESKKTRSGGKALKFYANLEIWLAVSQTLKKTIKDKPRKVGTITKVVFEKNRYSGNKGTAEIPIYRKFGIDDIGSCIDYLIGEKYWKKTGQTINADELEFEGSRKALIKHIEEEDLYTDLREVVQDCWDEIEELIGKDFADRKRKYD